MLRNNILHPLLERSGTLDGSLNRVTQKFIVLIKAMIYHVYVIFDTVLCNIQNTNSITSLRCHVIILLLTGSKLMHHLNLFMIRIKDKVSGRCSTRGKNEKYVYIQSCNYKA